MRRGAFILACLASTACGQAIPDTRYYELRVTDPPAARPAVDAPVLTVDRFEADAPYEEPQVIYRTGPHQLEYYHYHRWTSPPPQHVSDYLRSAYQRTGLFERVARQQTENTEVVLTGHVTRFEEVDVAPGEWLGQVEIELNLLNARTGEVIWSRTYEEVEPLEEQSPSGLAAALSRAMDRIVDDSAPAIARAASASRGGASRREPVASDRGR